MKKGFTLAEALTVLVVIGVIAALLMPTLATNVYKAVRAEQKHAAIVKLTKATELMALKGRMQFPYYSTFGFVQDLQKYYNIPRSCGDSSCPNCYLKCLKNSKIKKDDEVFDLVEAKKGTYFNNIADKNHAYNQYNISFFSTDGTLWLLTYNQNCPPLKPGVYPWSYENGKPITNATTACISGLLDVNADKGPNVVGDDVYLFNVTALGNNCPIKVGDKSTGGSCFSTAIVPAPLSYSDCMAQKDELGIQRCFDYGNDYWAGAVAACGGVDKVAGISDFGYIADVLYDKDFEGEWKDSTGLIYNNNAYKYNLPVPPFTLWTNNELTTNYSGSNADNIYAQTFTFNLDSTVTNNTQKRFDSDTASSFKVFCKTGI